ncbi:MAG: sulfite exporter TauE/SafE family protein, partial [Dietzia sp.]|nr:sulfite exporter TauE/SafE family protein [Dietzia sp.]
GHVMVTGVDWALLVPLLIGGSIGTFFGSRVAGRVPQGLIRRGITIVLAVTASAMLGASPPLIGVIALVLVTGGPLVWRALVRRYSVHLGDPAAQDRARA